MKLLRLTSDKIDGTFDGFLNQEIDIPAKSQIALQSLVFETQDEALVIDESNNEITFQTANATGQQSIFLTHTDGQGGNPEKYDSTNSQLFFDDLTNKINAQMKIINNNQIGKQFLLENGKDGKAIATFATSAYTSRAGELTSNINKDTVNGIANSNTLVITANDFIGSASNTNNTAGASKYKFFTGYDFPICRGCGIIRAQLRRFQRDGARTGGFTIALSTKKPSDAQTTGFTDADLIAGIQCLDMSDANMDGVTPTVALPYATLDNGVATNSTVNVNAVGGQLGFTQKGTYADGDTRNDHIEICITGNDDSSAVSVCTGANIEMNVYRRTNNGDASPTFIKNRLATKVYATDGEKGDDLYAYFFIHGAVDTGTYNVRLQNPRFTADPFMEANNNGGQLLFIEDAVDAVSLGSKPDPPRNRNTIHNIDFGEEEVYSWLGYNTGLQPNQSGSLVTFNATNLFGSKIVADAFLVQMLNLKLESYDAHITKEGRENLLAVIPSDDDNNRVIYEPNSLLFIDIDNKFPLKLSNLRLRVVKQDYSEVATRGLSSITLIINPGENKSDM